MIIDEAIKELNLYLDEDVWSDWGKFRRSIRLGIEALKWVEKERPDLYGKYPPLLPGETKE